MLFINSICVIDRTTFGYKTNTLYNIWKCSMFGHRSIFLSGNVKYVKVGHESIQFKIIIAVPLLIFYEIKKYFFILKFFSLYLPTLRLPLTVLSFSMRILFFYQIQHI